MADLQKFQKGEKLEMVPPPMPAADAGHSRCLSDISLSDNDKDPNIYTYNPVKSLSIRTIDWVTVMRVYYVTHIYCAIFAVIFWFVGFEVLGLLFSGFEIVRDACYTIGLLPCVMIILLMLAFKMWGPSFRSSVYCLDFEVATPPEKYLVNRAESLQCYRANEHFSEQSLDFQERILGNSGIGEKTYWPPSFVKQLPERGGEKPTFTMEDARAEAEEIIFPLVERLLAKTKCKPQDIDILIVNCSLFSPTPSLCAMIAHKFGMRENLSSYNLGGMGCSAGVISIDLAKQLIQNRPKSVALVVSTENLSQNFYTGNERSMMMQNTLFRCGGAAALLSSRFYFNGQWAKYKLLHSGRTLMTDDESYNCVFEKEDAENRKGVKLDRNIVNVAGRALTKQFTQLAPHILPISEQATVLMSMALYHLNRKLLHKFWPKRFPKNGFKMYTPDFRRAIDHFCIHAGGRAVIEGVQKNLKLTDADVEPSFMTLHNYGNTSSSSIWYELKYVEDNKHCNLKSGNRILQIAFGSGFKCNSAVWLRLRSCKAAAPTK